MANLIPNDVVAIIREAQYRTDITLGDHSLIADEPTDQNGSNLGPTPYQLLAASLAACTSITLRMYADRKKLPLTSVEVHVNLEKPAADQTKFVRNIQLIGELKPEEKERLLQVANACPIHKILSGKIEIQSALTE
ncbi:OsmC family protein [Leptospira ryugenii]|nr:OsmC family protein [Leptospira ryugenii]